MSSFSGVRHLITEAGGVSILSFLMHSGHLGDQAMSTCALAIANMSQASKHETDSHARNLVFWSLSLPGCLPGCGCCR